MVARGGALAAGCLLTLACQSEGRATDAELPASEPEDIHATIPHTLAVYPLSAAPVLDANLVSLGKRLFFSRIVADDGNVSCASCHLPKHGFADSRPLSQSPGRPETLTNTPSLWNVAYLDLFNWNGKQDHLGAHLDALIQNPDIVGTTWPALFQRLMARPEWAAALRQTFPGGATEEGPRLALLAYERSLISVGAPFDRWQLGDSEAISGDARAGFELFLSRGCVSCHQGRLLGGNVFERLGIVRPYFTDPSRDLGRYAVTQRDEDRHVFRVPSLRNVALTPPYLHDGSLPNLAQTVSVMANYQLGRDLDTEQVRQIVAFLEALSAGAGEQPAESTELEEPTP